MKWGVRRYQNKDGTLTAAGQKRYDRDVRENKAKKKENRIDVSDPDPKRWAKEDLERTKRRIKYNKGGYLQMHNDILVHHGVIGMKWGVRRYQNKDGSLTSLGKKRISKEYKKEMVKTMSALSEKYNKMYMDSYNKAADYMNNGGFEKFDRSQQKKHGDDFAKRDGYDEDQFAFFEKELTKNMNRSLNDFYQNDIHYQKSKALVDKYGMTDWDDLAKNNEEKIGELRKIVGKG